LLASTAGAAALHASDPPARREQARRMLEQRGQGGLWLEQARPVLLRGLAERPADATALVQQLALIDDSLATIESFGLAAVNAPGANVANAGSSGNAGNGDAAAPAAAALLRRTVLALQAVEDIEATALCALQARSGERQAALQRRQWIEAGVLGVLLIGLLYLAVCAYRVLAGGLRAVVWNLQELAGGNLGIRPNAYGDDEVGRALRSLGHAAGRLSGVFDSVNAGSEALAKAARGVAAGQAAVAQRAAEIRAASAEVARRTVVFCGLLDDCSKDVERAVTDVDVLHDEGLHSANSMATLRARMLSCSGRGREIGHIAQQIESASLPAAAPGGDADDAAAQPLRALLQRQHEAARALRSLAAVSVAEIEDIHRASERTSQALHTTEQRIENVHRSMADIGRQAERGMHEAQQMMVLTRRVEAALTSTEQAVDESGRAVAMLGSEAEALRRSLQRFVPH
jgi:methyl-accepting chemotaxis protein